jgi:pilus assembly protein CpaE
MHPLNISLAIGSVKLWDQVQQQLQTLPVRIALEQAGVPDLPQFIERLRRANADVLFLEPRELPLPLAEVIADLKAAGAVQHVVIVSESATAEEILGAIRAGADEFLYPPFAPSLKEALERLNRLREPARGGGRQEGRVIGVLSAKGGCGGTTLACHGAVELSALTGPGVLLADLDLGSGAVRILTQSKSRYSILDALDNLQRLDASLWHGMVTNGMQSLAVISGPTGEAPRELPAPHDVRQLLRFIKTQYGWTIADLGSSLSPLVLDVLDECDELLLVTTTDIPALLRTKVVLAQLAGVGLTRGKIHIVLNRLPRNGDLKAKDVENALGMELFATVPNDYRALEDAYCEGRLLPERHRLRHAMGEAVRRLAGVEAGSGRGGFLGLFR